MITHRKIQQMRQVLDDAVASRTEHQVEDQGIDIVAQLQPGEGPIFEELLCKMPDFVEMLDICEQHLDRMKR